MELEQAEPANAATIAGAWRRRWLDGRARRSETLAAMATLGPQTVRKSLALNPLNDLLSDLD
jgi:hypothetical protein